MDEASSRGDLQGNLLRQGSVRSSGSLKSTLSGRYNTRNSPSIRSLHSGRTPRRDSKGGSGNFRWFRGNHLVYWLILIALWAYLGFYVQSRWAHNDHSKAEFVGYKSESGGAEKVQGSSRTDDASLNNVDNSTAVDPLLLNGNEASGSKLGSSFVRKGRRISSRKNSATRKTGRRSTVERKLRSNILVPPKAMVTENKTTDLDEGVPRRNTSYGLLVGPFGKTEDSILGWSPYKRRGTCDRKGEFARLVWSRRFVLVFHELSMTGAPITMMELATELLSCGGTVSVLALSRKGGLMGELDRRGIKVKDKEELSYKAAMKSDLIIAGSAACSAWIEQYLLHTTAGSSQILWWIMENQREYFDRSKHMLNQVKMLTFLSESQSKQWLTWCEEEKIQLKAQPTIVPLSVNDELAFVAGITCSLNTPSFSTESMEEKKNLLRVAVRKEMGLSDDDMLVMSLSSISPEKGQLLLLESALVMSEQHLPLIDIKINSLLVEKNMSGVAVRDMESSQQANLSNKLEDVLLQTNTTSATVKKKRRKHSKSSRRDGRKSRNLLSQSGDRKEPALKVLIGSVGSKSNKVPYIKEMLRFLSQHSNISKSLLWTPAITRVSSLYAAADVYVINAQGLGETFGRVTVEAMAFGLPVLGTDAGGTREIVDDKVTGLLHPVGNEGVRLLAQNLQFLLSNPKAREQLGRNGRSNVENTYLKMHMFKKLAKVFVQCMKIK